MTSPLEIRAASLGLTLKTRSTGGAGRVYEFERAGVPVGAETGAKNAAVWLDGYAAGIGRSPEDDPRVWVRWVGDDAVRAFNGPIHASEWLAADAGGTAAVVICRGRRGVARVPAPGARAFEWRAAVESALSPAVGARIRQPTWKGAREGTVTEREPSGRVRVDWNPRAEWLDSWAWPSEIVWLDGGLSNPEAP